MVSVVLLFKFSWCVFRESGNGIMPSLEKKNKKNKAIHATRVVIGQD